MKKSLYNNLIKVITNGKFEYYQCYRDWYLIDYKYDGDLNVEEFIDGIIEYAQELQETMRFDNEIDEGCFLSFRINENGDLKADYSSRIDWVDVYNELFEDFKEKFQELDIKRLLDFNHKNFSFDNFLLNVEGFLKSSSSEITINEISLKYKIDDLVIDILNKELLELVVNVLKETLLLSGYAIFNPIFNNEFEMKFKIENNTVITFDEYFNFTRFTIKPE